MFSVLKEGLLNNKIHFTSLGCSRNLVDSEIMIGIALKAGYEITVEPEEAGYLVINTCGFLESARQEAIDTIEELGSLNPKAKLIVTGCMVQNHKQMLKERFPNIHYFLGSGDVTSILKAFASTTQGEVIGEAKNYISLGEVPRLLTTNRSYAYLKIAEGCKKQCAFCIIPKIKGKLNSKTIDQVEKEFHALLDQGVFEVVLIAQDLGDFGKDKKDGSSLEALLKRLLLTKRQFWLRLLYLYPDEITDGLIEIMAQDERICKYLDMPIQHINDEMLKNMHRKTNKAQILSTIEKLKDRIPNVVIRTSLMVGYPGEDQEKFHELVQFVKEGKLDQVGIFKYSKEELSYSANLPNHIEETIKESREKTLAKTQAKVLDKKQQNYVGQTLEVILDAHHPDSEFLLMGRHKGQCPEVDGCVIVNEFDLVDELPGIYSVEITQTLGYDLLGRVVGKMASFKPKESSSLALIG